MVTFRKKSVAKNIMPEAIKYLKEQGLPHTIIKPEQSDIVSQLNTKSMVLDSFMINEDGCYEIQVRDKKLYPYTQKLIKDMFQMRITKIDPTKRTVTAEVDHLGIALDIIEILAAKYNLSIVK